MKCEKIQLNGLKEIKTIVHIDDIVNDNNHKYNTDDIINYINTFDIMYLTSKNNSKIHYLISK